MTNVNNNNIVTNCVSNEAVLTMIAKLKSIAAYFESRMAIVPDYIYGETAMAESVKERIRNSVEFQDFIAIGQDIMSMIESPETIDRDIFLQLILAYIRAEDIINTLPEDEFNNFPELVRIRLSLPKLERKYQFDFANLQSEQLLPYLSSPYCNVFALKEIFGDLNVLDDSFAAYDYATLLKLATKNEGLAYLILTSEKISIQNRMNLLVPIFYMHPDLFAMIDPAFEDDENSVPVKDDVTNRMGRLLGCERNINTILDTIFAMLLNPESHLYTLSDKFGNTCKKIKDYFIEVIGYGSLPYPEDMYLAQTGLSSKAALLTHLNNLADGISVSLKSRAIHAIASRLSSKYTLPVEEVMAKYEGILPIELFEAVKLYYLIMQHCNNLLVSSAGYYYDDDGIQSISQTQSTSNETFVALRETSMKLRLTMERIEVIKLEIATAEKNNDAKLVADKKSILEELINASKGYENTLADIDDDFFNETSLSYQDELVPIDDILIAYCLFSSAKAQLKLNEDNDKVKEIVDNNDFNDLLDINDLGVVDANDDAFMYMLYDFLATLSTTQDASASVAIDTSIAQVENNPNRPSEFGAQGLFGSNNTGVVIRHRDKPVKNEKVNEDDEMSNTTNQSHKRGKEEEDDKAPKKLKRS